MTQRPEPDRKVGGRPAAEWLTAAAAIAAGTASYADVVRHDNPEGGGYHWIFGVLDVTFPHDAQPGFAGLSSPSAAYQAYFDEFYPAFSYTTTYQGGGGLKIFSTGFMDNYAAPLDAGTMVGSELASEGSFVGDAVFEFEFAGCDMYYVGYPCYCYYYDCFSGSRGIIPEGVETYLGVQFEAGSGPQYGWIKVVRDFVELKALAWGYETEPGVPIRVGAAPCDADLDGDGNVGFTDLLSLLSAWDTDGAGADLAAPVDVVDFSDLLTLIAAWGDCTPGGAPLAGGLGTLARGAGPD